MSLTIAIIGVIAAVASAVAAGGAWWSARQLGRVERDRRHGELTPEFDIIGTPSQGRERLDLRIALVGPVGLDQLDEVTVRILDEPGTDYWAHGLPDRVNAEEARLFVWGPWQFNAGASQQVVDCRTTRPREYSRVGGKNWDRLDLVRTSAGHWMTEQRQQFWRGEWDDKRIRLQFECHRDGYRPWYVSRDVIPDTAL